MMIRHVVATFVLLSCLAAPAPAQEAPPGGYAPKLSLHFPPPPDSLTQDYVARKFIFALLAGQTDTLRPLFAEEVQPYVTDPRVERMRSQISWLYTMIGGDFAELYTGGTDSTFFREYRFANETNTRSPMVVVHVMFRDSTDPAIMGAHIKNFLGDNEKQLAGPQAWKIGGKNVDIHSVVLAPVDSGHVLAIQFYDDTQDPLTQELADSIGIPVIREALARGWRDSAQAALAGGVLLDRIGVTMIRKDRHIGLTHARVGFGPESYELPAAEKGGKSKKDKKQKKDKQEKAAPAPGKTSGK